MLTTAVDMTDLEPVPGGRQRCLTFYAAVSSLIKGKAKRMAKQLKRTRNGYELWRKLCAQV